MWLRSFLSLLIILSVQTLAVRTRCYSLCTTVAQGWGWIPHLSSSCTSSSLCRSFSVMRASSELAHTSSFSFSRSVQLCLDEAESTQDDSVRLHLYTENTAKRSRVNLKLTDPVALFSPLEENCNARPTKQMHSVTPHRWCGFSCLPAAISLTCYSLVKPH